MKFNVGRWLNNKGYSLAGTSMALVVSAVVWLGIMHTLTLIQGQTNAILAEADLNELSSTLKPRLNIKATCSDAFVGQPFTLDTPLAITERDANGNLVQTYFPGQKLGSVRITDIKFVRKVLLPVVSVPPKYSSTLRISGVSIGAQEEEFSRDIDLIIGSGDSLTVDFCYRNQFQEDDSSGACTSYGGSYGINDSGVGECTFSKMANVYVQDVATVRDLTALPESMVASYAMDVCTKLGGQANLTTETCVLPFVDVQFGQIETQMEVNSKQLPKEFSNTFLKQAVLDAIAAARTL